MIFVFRKKVLYFLLSSLFTGSVLVPLNSLKKSQFSSEPPPFSPPISSFLSPISPSLERATEKEKEDDKVSGSEGEDEGHQIEVVDNSVENLGPHRLGGSSEKREHPEGNKGIGGSQECKIIKHSSLSLKELEGEEGERAQYENSIYEITYSSADSPPSKIFKGEITENVYEIEEEVDRLKMPSKVEETGDIDELEETEEIEEDEEDGVEDSLLSDEEGLRTEESISYGRLELPKEIEVGRYISQVEGKSGIIQQIFNKLKIYSRIKIPKAHYLGNRRSSRKIKISDIFTQLHSLPAELKAQIQGYLVKLENDKMVKVQTVNIKRLR